MPARRTLLALAAALAALLVFAGPAAADLFTPESGGSPNADKIDTLYKITLYISIPILLLVEGTLIYSLVKYKARRGGQAEQIRGNTSLELGWTIGAAVILVILTGVTFAFLNGITKPEESGPEIAGGVQVAAIGQPDPPGGKGMRITVNGQQYLWRYDYPGKESLFSYHEMVVPTDTTVTLDITSSDVVHSWWIPKLGGKADAVPGHTAETWFKISKPGLYGGQCAELCGAGHADMRAVVRAVPPDEFERWAKDQRAEIKAAQDGLASQRKAREAQTGGGG
ncbi:MAG: cytochrome c oxidase subunit II [Thermoleophilaceae bacterium]|nr:cytochrome c oxidase subunit II [Thermoleophilaceae bacterium]